MRSNFTYGMDSLKRINGNSANDYSVAQQATVEMQGFISAQLSALCEFSNLQRLFTTDAEKEIQDIVLSVRHVVDSLKELSAFHRQGLLNDIFDVARHRAENAAEQVEALANSNLTWLQAKTGKQEGAS